MTKARAKKYLEEDFLKDVFATKRVKIEEVKTEEEKSSQMKHLIDLSSKQDDRKELEKLSEERSVLAVISQSETQFKTLCFKPDPNSNEHLQKCSFSSTSIRADDSSPFKEFEKELRTRFETTSKFPYSVHGIVRADLGEGRYVTGSGILIGPDLVLTAAHNLFSESDRTKEKYTKVEFIPGINEGLTPFGVFKVVCP